MRDSGRVSAFVFQGIVGVDVRLFCLVDAGSRQPGDFKGCGAILFCGVWFSAFQGFPRGGGDWRLVVEKIAETAEDTLRSVFYMVFARIAFDVCLDAVRQYADIQLRRDKSDVVA